MLSSASSDRLYAHIGILNSSASVAPDTFSGTSTYDNTTGFQLLMRKHSRRRLGEWSRGPTASGLFMEGSNIGSLVT